MSKNLQGMMKSLIDKGSRMTFIKEGIMNLAQKHFQNKFRDQSRFDAVVLKTELVNKPAVKPADASSGGTLGASVSIYKAYVRPLDIHDMLVPEPCKFKDKASIEYCVSLHPIAMSETVMENGVNNVVLNPGDIVSCRYLKGPDNPQGMVGLRFKPHRVSKGKKADHKRFVECLTKTKYENLVEYGDKSRRPVKPPPSRDRTKNLGSTYKPSGASSAVAGKEFTSGGIKYQSISVPSVTKQANDIWDIISKYKKVETENLELLIDTMYMPQINDGHKAGWTREQIIPSKHHWSSWTFSRLYIEDKMYRKWEGSPAGYPHTTFWKKDGKPRRRLGGKGGLSLAYEDIIANPDAYVGKVIYMLFAPGEAPVVVGDNVIAIYRKEAGSNFYDYTHPSHRQQGESHGRVVVDSKPGFVMTMGGNEGGHLRRSWVEVDENGVFKNIDPEGRLFRGPNDTHSYGKSFGTQGSKIKPYSLKKNLTDSPYYKIYNDPELKSKWLKSNGMRKVGGFTALMKKVKILGKG